MTLDHDPRPMTPRLATLLLALVTPVATGVALSSCRQEPAESWGYVATLGNDTTSVERITRRGDQLTGDAVGRSPIVVRRRWEATLAPDGSVHRWVMDTRVPNAPAGERDLHHEMERSDGKIRLVRETGRDSTDKSGPEPWTRVVPWNAFLYATYDQLIQDARGLPDSTRIGLYFFEGWHEGSVGYGRVRQLGDGRVSIMSTGLAGSGVAKLDSQGRMLSYSGAGTTDKEEVRRVSAVPDLDSLFQRYSADELARGVPRALSVRDTARGVIGRAEISVDYSRPLRRGRTLLGGLIPYGQVWRTGANAATGFTTDADITINGTAIPKGSYTLFSLPEAAGAKLIVNKQTGQWGTQYDPDQDLARIDLKAEQLSQPLEVFTIAVENGVLALAWDRTKYTAEVSSTQ